MKILQTLQVVSILVVAGLKNASAALAATDAKGAGALEIIVNVATTDVNITTLKLVESDDNQNFTDVPGGALTTLPLAADGGKSFAIHVDMLGRKRYIKPVITADNGTTGATLAVVTLLGELRVTPNDATSRGFAGELFV